MQIKEGSRVRNLDSNPTQVIRIGHRIRSLSPDKSFTGKLGTVMDKTADWYAWVKFDGGAAHVAIDLQHLELLPDQPSLDVEKQESVEILAEEIPDIPDVQPSADVEKEEVVVMPSADAEVLVIQIVLEVTQPKEEKPYQPPEQLGLFG